VRRTLANEPDASVLVSVILAARDAAATIDAQLEALARQTFADPWELMFVDDGSRDATPEVVGAWRDRIPALRMLAAPGPRTPRRRERTVSRARNHAVAHSSGELLLFCDADDVVADNWIERMAEGLRAHPAVGGQIERERLSSDIALVVRPSKGPSLLDGGFGFLGYPMGANCGLRRDAWTAIGGFTEDYENSEDVDLFWRTQLAGYELAYVHDAIVHYRLRSTPGANAAQQYSFGVSHPRLYRDFAPAGMPRSSVRAALGEWIRFARDARRAARDGDVRARWLSRLALRAGRVVGSARNGVLYL
jgi:glycosyltransferase involved in cell wall biosynthesis